MSDEVKRPAWQPWLGLLFRIALAAVWVYAGYSKIGDPNSSVRAVRAYRLLPEAVVPTIGYALPIVEILLGLLLILGLFIRPVALVSIGLLTAFIFGIAWAWAHGLAIDCGCFGGGGEISADQTQYPQEIARDTSFMAMAAWLAWRPRTAFSLDRRLGLIAPEPAL